MTNYLDRAAAANAVDHTGAVGAQGNFPGVLRGTSGNDDIVPGGDQAAQFQRVSGVYFNIAASEQITLNGRGCAWFENNTANRGF